VIDRADVANRLVRKLGLLTTPGNDVVQTFAKRVRELQSQDRVADRAVDRAATRVAKEIFPAEFQPIRYASQSDDAMETLLADIENS
jgi:hypothetical protein